MTIDEAIKHAEEVAEENQRVVDTGIVCGDVTIDMLYCDDTEMIEEHLANYQKCTKTHRQLAEWLRELKKYRAIFEKVGKILADNGHTIDDLDTIFGKVNEEVNDDEDDITNNNDMFIND